MREITKVNVKKLLVCFIFVVSISATQPVAKADSVSLPTRNASLLEILNYYRLSSGVAPVIEDPQMSDGAQKHANYLSKTKMRYFVNEYQNLHTENPDSPYFTEESTKFGAGNIAWGGTSFPRPIDSLMTAPFHAIGFLREGLTRVGFGSAVVEQGGYLPGTQVTNVALIAGTENSPRTKIILFPGANSEIYLNDFTGENPEPRETCGSNFKSYRGLPIFVSLLENPAKDLSVEIKTPKGKILKNKADICLVTENNFISSDRIYGPAGKAIIAADHLVLIIPKDPLEVGKYNVTINQNAIDKIAWSFVYKDSIIKVENKVTINYPKSNKMLYSGDSVRIQVMDIEAGVSSRIVGVGATCKGKWEQNTLIVTGKDSGTCTVKVSGNATKNTKAFSKSFVLKFESKKT